MKSLMSCFVVGACSLFLMQCAGTSKETPQNEAILPEIDVIQVKENSDEALKIAQEVKLDIDVLNTKLTEIDNKLIVLSEEVSSVSTAKIEELENRLSLLVEAYKDLQSQVKALEAMPIRAPSKPKPPDPTFNPALPSSSEYDQYQAGLKEFNNRNYQGALKVFSEIIEQYPKGQFTENSHYWLGECHYALGDFASAIASFQKVLTFPNTPKNDDAQLKIGLSYLKMGQTAKAQTELQYLIDRYPASEYVTRAKKYLEEMK